jgi:hypothetical protein
MCADARRTSEFTARVRETPNVRFQSAVQLWGQIATGVHTLTVILDVNGTNFNAGSIFFRYCGFAEAPGVATSFACNCQPDLTAADGLMVGDEFWAWGSKGNCWAYNDTIYKRCAIAIGNVRFGIFHLSSGSEQV